MHYHPSRLVTLLLSQVEQLNIHKDMLGVTQRGNGLKPMQLLGLFHPFLAVQDLCIYPRLGPLVVQALQDLTGERASEVLPTLHTIFFYEPLVSGSMKEDMQPLIVACQHSDHPIKAKWIIC